MYFDLPPDTYNVNTLQEKNVYSNEKEWLCNHHKVITIMRISSEKTPFFTKLHSRVFSIQNYPQTFFLCWLSVVREYVLLHIDIDFVSTFVVGNFNLPFEVNIFIQQPKS